jgi:hypothetical protein
VGTLIEISAASHAMSPLRCVRLARLRRERALFFRDAAARMGLGPSPWTSDDYICFLFERAIARFREGCACAAQPMPNRWKLNCFVLKMLEVSELVGPEIAEVLIECEVAWYLEHGLRPIYDYELRHER